MKKIICVLVLLVLFFSVGKTAKANKTVMRTEMSIDFYLTYHVDATLSNEEYNQQLYLYKDGSCVIIVPNGRGTGTYNIDGNKIYITWANGVEQQGYVTKDDGQIRSVSIEGVTYSRKLVKSRR